MLALYILGIVVAMLAIWRACDGFEDASGFLGRNLSEGVRGATINAIGSSIPELLTASLALLFYANKDGFAFGIGTTAGSAIFNSAIIPALVVGTVVYAGLATRVNVSRKVILRDGLFLLGAEALLIYLMSQPALGVGSGLLLIGFYVAYITYMLTTMRSKDDSEVLEGDSEGGEEGNNQSLLRSIISIDLTAVVVGERELTTGRAWALLISAIVVIGFACHILVESCYGIGEVLGIRTYFIAVILAAAATSVPDTILSIKDAKAGNYDDAVANALGSNIFDICVCLGLPLVIYSLYTGQTLSLVGDDSGSIAELRILLFGLTCVIVAINFFSAGLKKTAVPVLVGMYILFVMFVIGRAYDCPIANKIGVELQSISKSIGGQ